MLKWLLNIILGLAGIAAVLAAIGYFTLKRDDIPYPTLAAKYESAASRYLDLPGNIRMHYRDEGSREPGAPVLLLVHGFSASLHTWEPWVQRLGDTYRIVSIDLPGHGLTAAPAGYQANIEAYRDLVETFAQAHGLERFIIAGSSMGGNVAWQYALARPGRVEGLILVGAAGWEDARYADGDEPQVFKLLRSPLGPLLMQLDSTRLVRQGLEASFYDPRFVDTAMVTRYTDLARAPGHRDILLQISTGRRTYATPEMLAPLAAIPVLVLHGDTDRLVPPEHGQQFANAISSATLVMYENVGHIPQEEIADRTAADVRAFVDTARVHASMASVN